ncbi:hypothetical protein FRC04_005753 [Tulasnella sp. 424]|nr:hypothetical protein FRC04_005753 [Tulasnella sp. 424]
MPTSLDAMARFFKGSSLRQGSAGPQLANTTEYAPLTGTWLRRHWRPFNLQSGHANIFIIICLCYRDVEWAEGGSMTLKGPREDLTLLLQRVQYRHQNETRQFLIFTDFEMDFQDHTGHSHQVPTIPATHRNIATRVQGTMQDLGRGDKCLLYFSGHIELDPPPVDGDAHIVLQGDRKLYDYELRTWLALSRFPTTTIIAILDACHSGGFLALPYLHDKDGKWVNRSEPASEVQMKSQVIEISSTTKPQSSYSAKYPEDQGDSGTTHGIFTWNLLQALKGRNFREPGA